MSKSASERLTQLDSLRGMAAATVVVWHALLAFPPGESLAWRQSHWLFWFTPVHALFAGGEAVMLFFVLSGFVLALPFWQGPVETRTFVVKRIFRIYPAYWCAVSLAFLCRWWAGAHGDLPEMSGWFNRIWSNPLTPGFVAHQYLLLGSFENGRLIPVVWSLVHEMRISLIFPWLMRIMLQWRPRSAVLLGLSLFFAGHFGGLLAWRLLHLEQDYTNTLIYIPVFMVGATLARYRVELAGRWRQLTRPLKLLALLGALLAYTYSWSVLPGSRILHLGTIPDMIATTAGCSLFIIAALGSDRARAVLCLAPLKGLGALSYSIYLLHTLVLVALVRLAARAIPPLPLLLLLIPITLTGSWVVYHLVEQPCIRLGRRIAHAGFWPLPATTRPRYTRPLSPDDHHPQPALSPSDSASHTTMVGTKR
jgi:peptidoglycan/LPS O-acetylase OafA/YrhL